MAEDNKGYLSGNLLYASHHCEQCDVLKLFFTSHPEFQFRPSSLKQQILLNLGYQLFDNPVIGSVVLRLPERVQNNIYKVGKEMKDWLEENEQLLLANFCKCFRPYLHWNYGSVLIDRKATTKVMLHCSANYSTLSKFLLSASNLIEEDIIRNNLNLLGERAFENLLPSINRWEWNPTVRYWVIKIIPHRYFAIINWNMIIVNCINRNELENLQFFWPKAVVDRCAVDKGLVKLPENTNLCPSLTRLCDHAFYVAIENENEAAMYFIWYNTPEENRISMISSLSCAHSASPQPFRGFHYAVNRGLYNIVDFLWKNASDEQRYNILSSNQFSDLCVTAEDRFCQVVKLLWPNSNDFQQLKLLRLGNCKAFRESCAKGDLNGFKLFWSFADDAERKNMFAKAYKSELLSIYVNGYVEILKYLLENTDADLKESLVKHFFSQGLMIVLANRREDILECCKFYCTPLNYTGYFCDNDFAAFQLLLINADGNDSNINSDQNNFSTDLSVGNNYWINEANFLLASLSVEQIELLLLKLPLSLRRFALNTVKKKLNVNNE